MTTRWMFPRVLHILLGVGMAAGIAGCRKEPQGATSHDQMNASPKEQFSPSTPTKAPAEVEELWNRRVAALNEPDPKARFGAEGKEFQKVLRADCSQADRHALLDYAANAPGSSSKRGFPRVVVAGLVQFYAVGGDRASLVTVLARACPQKVGLRNPEDFVVLSSRGIENPVTVLFDAFDQSKLPDARKAITDGLRRGFAFAGNLPANDSELVAWCKKWYEEHGAAYIPNIEYSQNSNMGFPPDRYQKNGLFVPKSK